MKRKDAGAVLVSIGIIIVVLFFVLPYLGIDIVNPFAPSVIATVKMNSHSYGVLFDANEGTTHVTFEKQATLSLIEPSSLAIPTMSTTQGTPSLQIYEMCIPFLGGGGDFTYRFEVPEANYFSGIRGPFHTCGEPINVAFRFPYTPSQSYTWSLEVHEQVW